MVCLDDTDQDYIVTAEHGQIRRDWLIPTDTRYEIVARTDKASCPATLTTPEDFENAPTDTTHPTHTPRSPHAEPHNHRRVQTIPCYKRSHRDCAYRALEVR